MPNNLLLVPLLAGFWFLHRCHYFRFRAQTLDGYRLLIEFPQRRPQSTANRISPQSAASIERLSGRQTLELGFTVDYASVVQQHSLDLAKFKVTVLMTSLRIATYFDQNAYPFFFIEESADDGGQDTPGTL